MYITYNTYSEINTTNTPRTFYVNHFIIFFTYDHFVENWLYFYKKVVITSNITNNF